MAKFLQQLLGGNEPFFSQGMHQLEASTGHAGVDTRLIADIMHAAHHVMRQLGLDPADTTAAELYGTLNNSIRHGNGQQLLMDTDFVLLPIAGQVVSFNLIDVIENQHHELPFLNRIVSHGQRALRGEIIQRYLDNPRTDQMAVTHHATHAGLVVEDDKYYNFDKPELTDETKRPSILAIGDIFTDAFIALDENEAHVDTDDEGKKWLKIPFGSKPPYDHVDIVQAVGPSPNAAVSFARLGVKSSLMAFLGDDQAGKDSLDYLRREKIDTSLVNVQNGVKSNYYYVLRYGADRTILVKDENFAYNWRQPEQAPDWIYLSLISAESWQLHEDLLNYLDANPDTKLAFQPGTFHFKWGTEKLARIYKRSYIVVINREEAVDVTGRSYDSIKDLADGLHELGPEVVVITDGPSGSYASYDGKLLTIPNYPDPAPPLDRTGAGDAFASTIVAALAQGESLEIALKWAPINSMSVVQKIGAQAGLLHREEVEKYLAEAPSDYDAKEMTEETNS
jgi:sugar/nucleoside kinase (ribokinase family)